MNRLINNRGSTAIFLCVVFTAFVLLAGILTDIAGVKVGEAYSERILDLASRSVLAEYDINLKNEYGLFGVELEDYEMEEKISGYMSSMFEADDSSGGSIASIDLLGLKVESVDCDLTGLSLTNIDLFENQVLDQIKYRALTGDVNQFSDSMNSVKEASSTMGLIEKAVVIYNELYKLDGVLNDIRKNSDGWYYKGKSFAEYEKYVKKISISESRYKNTLWGLLTDSQTDKLVENSINEKELKNMNSQYLNEFYKSLYRACMIEALKQAKSGLSPDDDAYKKITQYTNDFSNKEKINVKKYEEFYKDTAQACENVLFNLEKLRAGFKNINDAIGEFENYANDNKEKIGNAGLAVIGEIAKIKDLISGYSENKISLIKKSILADKSLLDSMITNFDTEDIAEEIKKNAKLYGNSINTDDPDISSIGSDIANIIKSNKNYRKMQSNIFSTQDRFIKNYDSGYCIELFSVKGISDLLKELPAYDFSDAKNDVSDQIKDSIENEFKKDNILKNEYIIDTLPSQQISKTERYKGKFSFNEKDGLDNFGFYSLLKLKAEDAAYSLRNNLLFNEYVLTYFSNRHMQDDGKKRLFCNEVEYILYGNMSDNENYKVFKENFIAVRMALNLMHIYSDPIKRAQVLEAAAAASGGVGVFFAQFLIASAWASAEAINDLKLIENGKESAFVKSNETWAVSFENIGKESYTDISDKLDSNSPNMFSYKDYLRLFLLFEKKSKKILRTMDIVQINMKGRHYKDFNLMNYYGACQVYAGISKKYLFLNCSVFKNSLMQEVPGRVTFKFDKLHSY